MQIIKNNLLCFSTCICYVAGLGVFNLYLAHIRKLNYSFVTVLRLERSDINASAVDSGWCACFETSCCNAEVFECNGKLSILPKSESRPATPKDLGIPDAGRVFLVLLSFKSICLHLDGVLIQIP